MSHGETKQNQKLPSNYDVAVYLAEAHREKMVNDEAFKKVAAKFNLKWRVLKRNFKYVCWVNDMIDMIKEDLSRDN